MTRKNNNIVLIGMPGCGKSTIGVVLAKVMGYQFIDSDLLIQEREDRLLSELIEAYGHDGFNKIENEVNSSICVEKSVIATGGSVIYGKEAMEHLREIGVVIYLRLSYEEIQSRLGDLAERGISMKEGQTLMDLYRERTPLYEQYAHIVAEVEGSTIREAVFIIKDQFQNAINERGGETF